MGLKVVPFGVCADTVKVLRALLRLALEGKIRGLALNYRAADGREETVLTGVYERAPQNAVTASARMFVAAARADQAASGERKA